MQKNFGVVIDDSNKLWTITGLESIQNGMQAIRDKMGDLGFKRNFDQVIFIIDKRSGMATTGNKDILVGDQVINNKDYVTRETVHELSHIWDNNCNDCLSKGMAQLTNSKEEQEYFLWIFPTTKRYQVGGIPPTRYARTGPREDWAESVTAYIFPGYLENNPWDQGRQNFIASALSINWAIPNSFKGAQPR